MSHSPKPVRRDSGREPGEVTLAELLEPLRRRARWLFGIPVGLMILTAVATLLLPRPFEATAILATVAPARGPAGPGALSGALALLGGGVSGVGVGPTPEFVAALLSGRRVLTEVGLSAAPGRDGSFATSLRDEPVEPPDIPHAMQDHLRVSISRETGLVSLTVHHRDSALARMLNDAIVGEMSEVFVATVRAQARLQRAAHAARVDSARNRLDRADSALRRFLSSNRIVPEFSELAVTRNRLQREFDLSQEVYNQATADYESAVARELQDTPAVVAVDPLPAVLPRRPRGLVIKVLLAGIAGLLIGVAAIHVAEWRMRERLDGE